MLSRFTRQIAPVARKVVNIKKFGTTAAAPEVVVVGINELHATLEWCLSSPCPVHCFEEPPIIVEIEHLENLKMEEIDY